MKIIKINESQKRRLFEAYQEGFSFYKLSELAKNDFEWNDWNLQYNYCVKWLGEPTSKGSSRCVFTLSDNYVLKLAYEKRGAGIAQNRTEYNVFDKTNSPLLAKILYHDENFTYLVSESVLPAEMEDFEHILGLTYNGFYHQHSIKEPITPSEKVANTMIGNDTCPHSGDIKVGFNDYFKNLKGYCEMSEDDEPPVKDVIDYVVDRYVNGELKRTLPYYENCISSNVWLEELKELIIKTKMGDFSLRNFGIVNRDGKPMIVVLDSGINREVWLRYYKNSF